MSEARPYNYAIVLIVAMAIKLLPSGEVRAAPSSSHDHDAADPDLPPEFGDAIEDLRDCLLPLDPIFARIVAASGVDEIDAAMDEAIDHGALQHALNALHEWSRTHHSALTEGVQAATLTDLDEVFAHLCGPVHLKKINTATKTFVDLTALDRTRMLANRSIDSFAEIDLQDLLHDPNLSLEGREALFRCCEGLVAVVALWRALDDDVPIPQNTAEHLIDKLADAGKATLGLLRRRGALETEDEHGTALRSLIWRASREPSRTWPPIPEDIDHDA